MDEFNQPVLARGEVVYDGIRYWVMTADRRVFPLAEIVMARYVGHTLL